ncbi:serine hydrolase domain-containing protein [Subtercola sp. RTI3]|uniref:serine hydrolase domain-containing protein n=1 Tax=Subtercola sp. RTI3 TaxID=3048639 RepID=UPI002B22FAD1|nr:serine hydrolase domain-containing protein [Subtercola sp. RTI3]
MALGLALSACAQGGSAQTVTSSPAAAVDSTCVSDVAGVISRQPTSQMTTAVLPTALTDSLDSAARSSFTEAASPGAIVGVRTPQGTWMAAYGVADPSTGAPMEVGMHTRIGSVTKTFTGTLLMQLAEDKKLSLDDTISRYIPGIPNGEQITLRQLASMTSGIASYTMNSSFTDVYFAKPETIFTPTELVAAGVEKSPIFAPGEQFNYSNTNTVLLGLVIEKVTGESISDVFAQRILKPLGLTSTSWPGDQTAIPEPYAQGFTVQGDFATPSAPSNATNWNPAWGFTAGEMISNMPDLLTYGRALATGQGLLDTASQTERLMSFPGAAGYGIALGCIGGWVGHTGELPGYNTSLFSDTSTDTTVVVQTNSDIPSGDCELSAVLTDDPRTAVCSSPATRMFVALSTALGHTFTPNPSK